MSDFDAVLSRLPHAGPMLFIDRVVSVADPVLVSELTLRDDFILNREGEVSPLVAIELFAQSAAALMAHRSAKANAPKVSGALLGTRRLDCHVNVLRVGDVLQSEVREIFGAGALAQFDCVLYRVGGDMRERIAEGSINVAAGAIG